MIVKVLRAVVFIVCAIIIPNALAQNATVRFAYDESGNRIRRSLIIAKAEQDGKSLLHDKIDEDSALALNKDDVSGISVYPNPTADKFTVELPDSAGKTCHIALYSMTGLLLEERDVAAPSNLVFDLTGKPTGTYLLHIVLDAYYLLNAKHNQFYLNQEYLILD